MSRGTRIAGVLAVLAVALGGVACSKESAAREAFAKERSCPIEGVVAKERSAYELTFGKPTSKPPADIANDLARVELWRQLLLPLMTPSASADNA